MKKQRKSNFISAIEARYPGLAEKIKGIIEESEKKFSRDPERTDSYLWEHSTQVASLSYELARAAKMEPVIPAVAALFHDAGKFADGQYHDEERVEEEKSASIADRMGREAGMKPGDVRRLTSGLRALYKQSAAGNTVADIVHDADFLSKFGALGVANFFIKSTLRGKTLQGALMSSLSKELTYAACLPSNMRTRAGRLRATRKSRDTLKFFRSLLRELRETQVADFVIRPIRVYPESCPPRPADVQLAVPRCCQICGSRWTTAFRTEQGIKCEKLEAEIRCAGCGNAASFSFCLPEIPGRLREKSSLSQAFRKSQRRAFF
jgi:HD superfamily phosphodiesterase